MTLGDFCLQLVMVAAEPRRVSREKLRDCDGRKRSHQTLSEYASRFNGWYLDVTRYVHNTEI